MSGSKWLSMVLLVFVSLGLMAGDHVYVGAKKCGSCHKGVKKGEQKEIWENSKHAKAMETLKGDEAAKIAKEKGLAKPAFESQECLKCHQTAYDVDAALLHEKFNKDDGVQCETCHGAGDDYKSKKIMKDRQASIDNGMIPISVEDGSAEKNCKSCHNDESPTFESFDFKESWDKIKHPLAEGGADED